MTITPTELNRLFNNLHRIYEASHDEGEGIAFYSSDGMCLVDRRRLLSRLNIELKPLEYTRAAFEHTVWLWHRAQNEFLTPHLDRYEQHLIALAFNHNPNQRIVETSRCAIQEWNEKTRYFLDRAQLDPLPPKFCQINWTYCQHRYPFQVHESKRLERVLRIIALELLGGGSLPINDWIRLGQFEESTRDVRQHQAWVQRFISHGGEDATPSSFYDGVSAVAEFLRLQRHDFSITSTKVSYQLWMSGEQNFFKRVDPKHVAWRDTLYPGMWVGNNVLGQRLMSRHDRDDKVTFVLGNREDCLLKVFSNRALPHLFAYALTTAQPSIPIASIVEMDPRGGFLLQERLIDLAQNIPRRECTPITQELAQALTWPIQLMQQLARENWVPYEVSLEVFMRSREDQMKAFRPYTKMKFWQGPLEDYADRISGRNLTVFKQLMTDGGTRGHSSYAVTHHFAMEALRRQSLTNLHASGVVATTFGESRKYWIERMEQFRAQVAGLSRDLLPKAEERFQPPSVAMEKVLAAITGFYEEYHCITHFPAGAFLAIQSRMESV